MTQENDDVLLRLHREYTKDETIENLSKQVSQLKFRIGELQSENAELKDKVRPDSSTKVDKAEMRKDAYVAELLMNIKDLNVRLERSQKSMKLYRDKYFSLNAITSQSTTNG